MDIGQKLFYGLMTPALTFVNSICDLVILFKDVSWKAIPHQSTVTIDDLEPTSGKSQLPSDDSLHEENSFANKAALKIDLYEVTQDKQMSLN